MPLLVYFLDDYYIHFTVIINTFIYYHTLKWCFLRHETKFLSCQLKVSILPIMNNNWNLFPSLLNVAHKRQIDSYDKATTPAQEKSEGSALLLQEQLHLRI